MAKVVINTKDFTDEFDALIFRARYCAAPLQAWGQHMVGSVKRNFQEQGRPNPWAPLKVNTLVRRYMRGKTKGKEGGRFAPNPKLYKTLKGLKGSYDNVTKRYLGETDNISTIPGMMRSSKTGRVLRARHRGYNKFAPSGMAFRRPALRAILAGQILIDSGQLRSSITSKATQSMVEIGTNKVYAGTHQFGNPKFKIPARPFLVIQPDDQEEFAALLTDWISGRWGGAR